LSATEINTLVVICMGVSFDSLDWEQQPSLRT
jgi:hypothetical protein